MPRPRRSWRHSKTAGSNASPTNAPWKNCNGCWQGAQLGLTADAAGARYRRYRALVCALPSGDAPPLPRCKDRDDQKFLELAARAGADLLVSRDNALLRLRGRTRLAFRIVAPAAAVALLPPATATGARSLPS